MQMIDHDVVRLVATLHRVRRERNIALALTGVAMVASALLMGILWWLR